MQKKRSIKIISVVLILVLLCVSITYVKSGNKEVLATTKKFNTENLQDNEHMHVELDNSGDKVPVPNGYVGSKATGENEIDTGYVIYEGIEEVNDSNLDEAQKTRNQYVWIPVPDATTMYGTDANGKKWGKLYDFTTDTGEGIDPVTGAKPLNWSEENGVMKIISNSDNKEPDIIIDYDTDTNLGTLGLEVDTAHEFLLQLEKEFNKMIDSMQRYGGFYVGRYETGNLSSNIAIVVQGNTDINYSTWYNSYKTCKTLTGENKNVETGLIWGCQWDRTLMWLIDSGNKTKHEICEDSTGWGNYKNAEFEYIDSNGELAYKKLNSSVIFIPTGNTEYTKANNIYDLAGNAWEWTAEANSSCYRRYRGGRTGNNGSSQPVNHRARNNPTYSSYGGCRAMLYIK